MARGNIQRVRIRVDSEGSARVQGELKDINKEIENIGKGSENTSKILNTVNRKASVLVRTLNNVANAGRSMNEALNGDTQETTRRVSSYIDNLDLLIMTMKDLRREATSTGDALNRVVTPNTNNDLRLVNENLGHLIVELNDLNSTARRSEDRLSEMNHELRQLESHGTGSEHAVERLNLSMNTLNHNMAQVARGAVRTNTRIQGFTRSGNSAIRTFSKMVFGMNPLVQAYAAIAVNVYAASEAFRVLNEAASFDRLEQSTADFTAALSGVNIKSLSMDLQEASMGALSFRDAMNLATRGTAYKFSTSELTELTELTRKASIALGRDFTDSIDRATRGISKQEIEILDEIGVITKLTTAFENYVSGTDRTVDSLNELERQTALTLEVTRQLKDKFGGIKPEVTDWERLGVAVKDLADSSLVKLAKVLAPVAGVFADVVSKLTDSTTSIELITDSLDTAGKALETGSLGQAIVAISEANKLLLDTSKESEETLTAQATALQFIGDTGKQLLVTITALTAAYFTYKTAVVVTTIATSSLVTSTRASIALMYSMNAALVTTSRGASILAGSLGVLRGVMLSIGAFLVANPIGVIAAAVGALVALGSWSFFDENETEKVESIGIEVDELRARVLKLQEETRKSGFSGYFSEDQGKQILDFKQGLDITVKAIKDISVGLKDAKTPLEAYLVKLKQLNGFRVPDAVQDSVQDVTTSFKQFLAFSDTLSNKDDYTKQVESQVKAALSLIESGITSGKVFANLAARNLQRIRGVHQTLVGVTEEAIESLKELPQLLGAINASVGLDSLDKAKAKLEEMKKTRDLLLLVNTKEAAAVQKTIDKELLKIGTLEDQKALTEARASIDKQATLDLIALQAQHNELASEQTKIKLNQLEANMLLGNQTQAELDRLSDQRDILQAQLALQKQLEAEKARGQAVTKDTAIKISSKEAQLEVAPNKEAELKLRQEILDLKREEILLNERGHEQQMSLISLEQERTAIIRERASVTAMNLSALTSSVAGLDGLSQTHTSLLNITGAFSDVTASYQEFMAQPENAGTDIFTYFADNKEALLASTSQIANSIGSMYSSMQAAKVQSIDAEIAAEKKRDGKSVESMAKIRKLEAKRAKEEARSKKASVIMSTATGIMQGYAMLGPIGGTAFAAAMLAISAMQMSAIDKAASGQLAATSGGLGLSAGKRDNTVDVSKTASGGEAAYLSGGRGTGSSATNFIPGRSGGGMVGAGTSVVVGERGPEIITPSVDVGVSSTGSSEPVTVNFSPVINASMLDASGFEEVTTRYNEELYNGLEVYLNANGKTLQSL